MGVIMRKINFLLFMFALFNISLVAKNSFFLENRDGILVKVEPSSAYKGNYPEKKGPALGEIKLIFEEKEFNDFSLKILTNEKEILLSVYKKDGNNYLLNSELEELVKVARIIENSKIAIFSYEKINKKIFEEKILASLRNEEKDLLTKRYKLIGNNYHLQTDIDKIKKLYKVREIFLKYNEKNEIYNGLEVDGSPMPHSFPRVHNAKSKAHFDIHLAWGVRIEDKSFPGSITIGFALNITNFTMFSLELITFKYGFDLINNPLEPYIGFGIYGGYLDGFPIGINLFGGVMAYPISIAYNDPVNRKMYILGEVRMGPVIYVPVYFDTGLNTETIYKKISVLMEGGIYTGFGYIFK